MKEIIRNEDLSNPGNLLAILKLSKPVKLSSKVETINLLPEKLSDLAGKSASVYGWERQTPWQITQTLQRTRMEILSNLVCQFFFGEANVTITRNHVCGLREEHDGPPCRDDIGSEYL